MHLLYTKRQTTRDHHESLILFWLLDSFVQNFYHDNLKRFLCCNILETTFTFILWQYAMDTNAIFVQKILTAKAYSAPNRTSAMELFAKIDI